MMRCTGFEIICVPNKWWEQFVVIFFTIEEISPNGNQLVKLANFCRKNHWRHQVVVTNNCSLFEEIWCGWRLFSDIVEFQICEIPQIFPRHSQVSPNVLLFAQTFYLFTEHFLEVLEMFKIPATIRGRWHLIQNPQTVTVSPKYSPSCGKLYSLGDIFVECSLNIHITSAPCAICSPNSC